jgi:hypothetical protein
LVPGTGVKRFWDTGLRQNDFRLFILELSVWRCRLCRQRRRPVRRSCCRLTAASTAIWIQRMSGTLSGFSVPSGMHVCPALRNAEGLQGASLSCQSAWFGVSGAATLVFLLAPGSKFGWILGGESFLVVSRQLIVNLSLRGCNRGVPKTLSRTS